MIGKYLNLNFVKGFALGALVNLLDPFARLLVLVLAIRGHYPWWLSTPDDPRSPFGMYEPRMREVYERRGRYWGDVTWLAGRNVLFGLSYAFKPDALMSPHRYRSLSAATYGPVTFYQVNGYPQATVTLFHFRGRPFGLQLGWKVDGYLNDPFPAIPAREPNMQGRPIVSIRWLD